MRFLPAILAKIYRPVPLMDAQSDARDADPIARDLDAAVREHERVGAEIRSDYTALLKQTMDDLFLKLEGKDVARG